MKTALITGASAGIGSALAKLFVKDGHSVVLVARRQDRLEQLSAELKLINEKVKVHTLSVDLSKNKSAEEVFAFTQKEKIEVDFLVNNAGFGSFGNFSNLELAKELEMIDLNVRTLVALTHLYLPSMLNKKFGRILNVGSMAGYQPGPYMTIYYATKAFVNSFSEGLAHELKGSGVSCTVLAPGPTETEFKVVAKMEKNKLFNFVEMADAEEVAQAGYDSMLKGEAICIPGVMNKFLVQSLRVTPRALIRKITGSLNSK